MSQDLPSDILVTALAVRYAYTLAIEWAEPTAVQDPASYLLVDSVYPWLVDEASLYLEEASIPGNMVHIYMYALLKNTADRADRYVCTLYMYYRPCFK